MKQTIIIPELSPMLNGKDGLKRLHWAKYGKIRDRWAWMIRAEKPKKHDGSVVIHFVRHSTASPDWDNLYAGFKVIGDGLQSAGIIADDSMKIVKQLTADWKKAKQKDQRMEIIIEDVK